MKKTFIIVLFSTLLAIAWCGSSSEKTVQFDNFTIQLWNTYNKVDSNLIMNKQITDKIVAAYKQKLDWFDENIIITKWALKKNYNIEDVAWVNIDKLKTQVVGYQQKELLNGSFNCNWQTINWVYHTFTVPKTINSTDKYTLLQYYFIYQNQSYVVSFSTESDGSIDTFKKYIKTIACK